MVTLAHSGKSPTYSLQLAQQLAAERAFAFVSEGARAKAEKYGYDVDSVIDAVLALRAAHYWKSEQYPNSPAPMDVYLLKRHISPTSHQDDLYIKFKLINGCMLLMCSFHPENMT